MGRIILLEIEIRDITTIQETVSVFIALLVRLYIRYSNLLVSHFIYTV